MDSNTYFLVFLLLGLIGPTFAEYCTEHRRTGTGYTTRTIHCSFGCCGDYYDQYCCSSSTGLIVGLVFAGIFAISVIVAVVCCCIKHKGQRGRVIRPNTTTFTTTQPGSQNVFIVPPSGPQPPSYPYGGAYPAAPSYYPPQGYSAAMPPAYSTGSAPPPAYTPEGPKYPPPPPPNPYAAAAGSGN